MMSLATLPFFSHRKFSPGSSE